MPFFLAQAQGQGLIGMVPFVLVIFIFYFLVIRPQNTEQYRLYDLDDGQWDLATLRAELPAFLLGNIAPDVQTLSGQSREALKVNSAPVLNTPRYSSCVVAPGPVA